MRDARRLIAPLALLLLWPRAAGAQETPLDSARVELTRARGFIRAAETQLSKSLELVERALAAARDTATPPPVVLPPDPEPADTVATPPPDTLPGQGVHQVPGSIDASGAADVTAALNAWLGSVPDSSILRFTAGARYRMDGTLRLHDRHGLTLDGAGALLFTDAARPDGYGDRNRFGALELDAWRERYHIDIEGGGGITLRNLTIRGANAGGGQGDAAYVERLEAQHGVNISGADHVLIENVDISYVFGDFVYVGSRRGPDGENIVPRNITVRGGVWSHNGRQGFATSDVDGLLIDGISMTETRRASIDLEANTSRGMIRNVVIRNSYFGPGRLHWIANGGGGAPMENIVVENNRLDRTMGVWIKPPGDARRSNFRFTGNVSTAPAGGGSHGAAFSVWNVDGFVLEGNTAPVGRSQTGAVFYASCRVVVGPDQFPGAPVGHEIRTPCPE